MNCFDSVSAMSVDRFAAVSVMYSLIHRGSFARLSARANRCSWHQRGREHERENENADAKRERTRSASAPHKRTLTAAGERAAHTLSAKTISPQSVFPRKTRPTHCAAFRIASKPRNSDSRIRYASRRYSSRALRIRLSVYWYGTLGGQARG